MVSVKFIYIAVQTVLKQFYFANVSKLNLASTQS